MMEAQCRWGTGGQMLLRALAKVVMCQAVEEPFCFLPGPLQ